MRNEKGVEEGIWLSNELLDLVKAATEKLGLSRSGFYRYAILQTLERLSLMSSKLHEGEKNE